MFAGTVAVVGAVDWFAHVAAFVVTDMLIGTVTSVSTINWAAFIVAACFMNIVVVGAVTMLGTCDLGTDLFLGIVIKVTDMFVHIECLS